MKSWFTFVCGFTGEPQGGVVCGECIDKHAMDWHEIQEIRNPRDIFSDKCCICEKNCGDYFNRKAA